MLQLRYVTGESIPFPTRKIVCVGRNYAEHAKELNNPVPAAPILFMKPATSLADLTQPLSIPSDRGAVHFETELALLIGETLRNATTEQAADAIAGYGLALDLTLRDLQSTLKEKSHPWEIAKGFDGACPVSPFVAASQLSGKDHLTFDLKLNGEPRQHGDTRDMITPVLPLLAYMSQHFTLEPGDIILTGTPAGVGALTSGMTLELTLEDVLSVTTTVA